MDRTGFYQFLCVGTTLNRQYTRQVLERKLVETACGDVVASPTPKRLKGKTTLSLVETPQEGGGVENNSDCDDVTCVRPKRTRQ